MGHVIRADVSVFVSGASTRRANSLVQYGDEHGGDERPEQRRASTTVLAELINVYAILLFFAMDGHLLLVSVLYKGFTYWPIGNALHPQTLRTIALAF